jgi:hypothetical protein
MAKQDLEKYCMHPHVSTMDNIYVILCYNMCTRAVRDSWLTYDQPIGCVGVHSNLRARSSLCYFIEFKAYYHPYYNMTSGFKSLGLDVVLS